MEPRRGDFPATRVRTLLAGDWPWREFARTVAWLSQQADLHTADGFMDAVTFQASGDPARLVVIAQAHPGQWTAQQAQRLAAAAPLARTVALLGSLCQGEMRTGKPWAGIERIYFHEGPPRLAARLAELQSGAAGAASLPRTAASGERLLVEIDALARSPNQRTRPSQSGAALVVADSQADFDGPAEVCRRAGLSPVWLRPPAEPPQGSFDLVLCDAGAWRAESLGQLRRLRQALAEAPLVALVSFPHEEDLRAALDFGAAAVLAKPFSIADLLWHVQGALR